MTERFDVEGCARAAECPGVDVVTPMFWSGLDRLLSAGPGALLLVHDRATVRRYGRWIVVGGIRGVADLRIAPNAHLTPRPGRWGPAHLDLYRSLERLLDNQEAARTMPTPLPEPDPDRPTGKQ